MRKLRSTVAGSKLDLYRSSHPSIPAIQETKRRLLSIGLSREGPLGVKPYFGYPSNDPTRRAWPPYAISDKLDDTLLQVLATRLEARGQHPRFQAMFTEYLDAINIDAAPTILDLGCGTGVAARAIARRKGFAGIERRIVKPKIRDFIGRRSAAAAA